MLMIKVELRAAGQRRIATRDSNSNYSFPGEIKTSCVSVKYQGRAFVTQSTLPPPT
jgi:hypothetical protein